MPEEPKYFTRCNVYSFTVRISHGLSVSAYIIP